jgi:hypothetical protein
MLLLEANLEVGLLQMEENLDQVALRFHLGAVLVQDHQYQDQKAVHRV